MGVGVICSVQIARAETTCSSNATPHTSSAATISRYLLRTAAVAAAADEEAIEEEEVQEGVCRGVRKGVSRETIC